MRNKTESAVTTNSMDKGKGEAVVACQTDRWSVIPRVSKAPTIDGRLDDAAWTEASRMSGFRAVYINEPVCADSETEMWLACDDSRLFIGIAGKSPVGERVAAEKIDIVISAPNRPDRYFHIPIDITRGPREMITAYGHGVKNLERPEPVISALHRKNDGWTLEVTVPLDAVMEAAPQPGGEWRINVIRCFGLAAPKPLSSLVPIRQSSIIDLGPFAPSYSVRIDALTEGRMGGMYWQRPPLRDNGHRVEKWIPAQAVLIYRGFTEKRLHLNAEELTGLASVKLMWRTPSAELVEINKFELDAAAGTFTFHHPKPLEVGWYELQLTVTDHTNRVRFMVLSFDSQALIDAGESLHVPLRGMDTRIVEAAPPSEEVNRLLKLIPPQPGVIFGGDPECPELYAGDKRFRWDPDDPFALVSVRTGRRYPNDRFPEDKSYVVHNRKGEEVRVPYREDAGGKRYLIKALLWYEQKIYALKQTSILAKKDPLGAARLLKGWADAYEGWVPTNDYPWGCYPTETNAGPPYHYWGGVWSRWSTSDLGELRHLVEAYAEVKKTNAFELLSEEEGIDVDRKIVEGMFRPSFEFFDSFPNWNHNNDYHNWIGLIALSKATGHPRFFHQALERIQSFVAERFLFDGFFSEVCASYHLQSIGGLQTAIDAAKGWSDPAGYISPRTGRRVDDLDLKREYPVMQSFNRVIEHITYPDGHYFPIQDTWAFSKSKTPALAGQPMFLPAAGIARLTLGSHERQLQLYMSYVPKYGHDHLDPLNMALFACGQEMVPDIGYTHTLYRQWTRSTLCHNTVVVDGKDMNRTSGANGGNLQLFAACCSDVQVMKANQESAYSNLREYSREMWLIGFGGSGETSGGEGYVVDLFRIQGGSRHEYTLNGDANRDSVMESNVPLKPYGPNLLPAGTRVTWPTGELEQGDAEGEYYGYMYVQDVLRAEIADGRYEVTLKTEGGGRLKSIGFTDSDAELFLGKALSLRATRLHDKTMDNNAEAVRYTMPKLVVRREGTDLNSRFVHVMEPYPEGSNPRIRHVELLQPEQSVEGDIAIAVSYGSTTDIILSSNFWREQPMIVGDIRFAGRIGFIRIENGEVVRMQLIGGTLLHKGRHVIRGDGPVEGTIIGVLRKAEGASDDALVTEATVPDDAAGRTVIVTHPDGSTNGYRIRDIVRESGRTHLLLDRTDPGFAIRDDGSSEMMFYPFKKWSGPHRFRIDNIETLR
ncbi:hypothetical protein FE783_17125 [Paenibacillus mesophilus]|uniref:heparinase II/III domain-containing protein n=1 Tax=Paenibacillus mesophilus TaxID=2582849 RepID=UPI00110DAF05|nr:heparinase II/III family protein [Paenibacillus mesophilus]TMV48767.1 hypothetical protein FE783_17125 [Paenibacillus mesophilus]